MNMIEYEPISQSLPSVRFQSKSPKKNEIHEEERRTRKIWLYWTSVTRRPDSRLITLAGESKVGSNASLFIRPNSKSIGTHSVKLASKYWFAKATSLRPATGHI